MTNIDTSDSSLIPKFPPISSSSTSARTSLHWRQTTKSWSWRWQFLSFQSTDTLTFSQILSVEVLIITPTTTRKFHQGSHRSIYIETICNAINSAMLTADNMWLMNGRRVALAHNWRSSRFVPHPPTRFTDQTFTKNTAESYQNFNQTRILIA